MTPEERKEMIIMYSGFALTGIMTKDNTFKNHTDVAKLAYGAAEALTDLIESKEPKEEE